MELQIVDVGSVAKVSLHGHLDAPSVDRIETRFLAGIVPAGRNTVVDLSGVTFVSSMGIRMLLGAARALRQKHAQMILFGAQPLVAESLSLVITQIIPLVESESQALALLSA